MNISRRGLLVAALMAPVATALGKSAIPSANIAPMLADYKEWRRGVPFFTGFKPSQDNCYYVGQWLFSWWDGPSDKTDGPERNGRYYYVNVPGAKLGGEYIAGQTFDISDSFRYADPRELTQGMVETVMVDGLFRLYDGLAHKGWNRDGFVPTSIVDTIPYYKLPKVNQLWWQT